MRAALASLWLALWLAQWPVLAPPAAAQGFVAVPPLQTRVTDKIGMLTENQRNTLENVLKEYEDRSGSQIAVLLIASTAPETIEQYSIRVADEWKLGREGIDDGVLLIVARNNPPDLRRLRIEAFRGVQGTLTDARSRRIIDEVIAPHFRQNDYYGGLSAAVSAIISLLDAEQLPASQRQREGETQQDEGWNLGSFLLMLLLLMLLMRRRARRHRRGWGRSVPGVILGGALGHGVGQRGGRRGSGGSFGGNLGGGFSGRGGRADGGGASGNW